MRADARGGQVQAERRAQAAGADQQHLGGLQLLLPFDADLGDDQVAAVAQDLVVRERRFGSGGAVDESSRRRSRAPAKSCRRPAVGRGVLAQVADVFVVQIDVDEAAQLAFVGEDLLAQVGVLGGQRGQHFARPSRRHGHRILLPRELPQRRRDQNFGHISKSTPLLPLRSVRSSAASYWRGEIRPSEWIARRTNTTDTNSSNRSCEK